MSATEMNKALNAASITLAYSGHELSVSADRFYWSDEGSWRRSSNLGDIMRQIERIEPAIADLKRAILAEVIEQLGWNEEPPAFKLPPQDDSDDIPF